MWFDDMDRGGKGICQPAQGPLGRAIRGLRHELWLSQAQLAAMVDVDQRTISRLELGHTVNWRLFCRIVEAVGGRPAVTVDRVETPREVMDKYAGDWW